MSFSTDVIGPTPLPPSLPPLPPSLPPPPPPPLLQAQHFIKASNLLASTLVLWLGPHSELPGGRRTRRCEALWQHG